MSTTDALLRLLPALVILLGALWAAKRIARRSGGASTVRNRTALTRGANLVTVEIGGRLLVLGVTDHQVSVVAEVPHDAGVSASHTPAHDANSDRTPARPASNPRPWTGLIAQLRWMTSRTSVDDLPDSSGAPGLVRRGPA